MTNHSNNMELWNRVEKTNPEYTKKANVKGNKITSIAPQYQIKQATEQFGPYGGRWGFSTMSFDYSLMDKGMIVFHANFFSPEGSFPIVNSVQLYKDADQTKIDDDFAKKVETDTLTKALSKLGFNADIFLGRFDDTKYVDQMVKEFTEERYDSEQLAKYHELFDTDNALGLYLFSQSIPDTVYDKLHSTHDKPKMENKKKANDLHAKGLSLFQDICDELDQMAIDGDVAAAEIIAPLKPEEKKVIAKKLKPETLEFLKNLPE